ncbi:hypothetical protein [Rubinisphaera brasiliensis]|uniref:Uncharacterized protein n=1 Tax=Rubinisphaera brasiliensis (strain ATCC 49424 / DSM 5305 / JCM 21570 / IAM 15109 / NBRC 103401 / IFAM 1448) TaxID=756272 RepID=F0SGA2_RUBBR|nr:hypothetical protein [Rubinisphaera brasiliensis]ADY59444.1 hypothetical protein Plabr_1834 [Rubinisphaera brasiliensis DSM 5305]
MTRMLFVLLLLSPAMTVADDPRLIVKRAKDIASERKAVIEDLISFIESTNDFAPGTDEELTNNIVRAMYQLGELKAVEVAPVLVDRLTYMPETNEDTLGGRTTIFYYPAAETLARLGSAGAEAVLSRVLRNPHATEEEIEVATWVVIHSTAKNRALDDWQRAEAKARFVVYRTWYENETNSNNFEKAAKIIDRYEPSSEPPVRLKNYLKVREQYSKPLPRTPIAEGAGFF